MLAEPQQVAMTPSRAVSISGFNFNKDLADAYVTINRKTTETPHVVKKVQQIKLKSNRRKSEYNENASATN